jgi:protease-4
MATDHNNQKITINPKLKGFLISYIIFSLPGFLIGLVWLLISAIILFGVVAGMNSSEDNQSTQLDLEVMQKGNSKQGILVYDLRGPIVKSEQSAIARPNGPNINLQKIKKDFDKIREMDKIKNVVFRVNSGGGEIFASQMLGQEIQSLTQDLGRKESVFYFNSISASGALYAAYTNPENYVVGNQFGQTGSVGVIGTIPNLTGTADKVGYSQTVIKTGDLKNPTDPFSDLTQKERKYIEDRINTHFDNFKTTVQQGRSLTDGEMQKITNAQVFLNSQAKDLNLLDQTGDLSKSLDRAVQNAELQDSDYKVWKTKRPQTPFEEFFGVSANNLFNFSYTPLSNQTTSTLEKVKRLKAGKPYMIYYPGI